MSALPMFLADLFARLAFRIMVWRWKLAAYLLLHPALYALATTLRVIR